MLVYSLVLLTTFALLARSQFMTSKVMFQRVEDDNEEESSFGSHSMLHPQFFKCGRADSCSDVVMFKDTQEFRMVNGKAELLKIKQPVVVWEKVKNDEAREETQTPEDQEKWTVIQRRIDNTTDFYRNWTEYKEGFGNETGNWWIGLDKLHALTGAGNGTRLNITMKFLLSGDAVFYAQYSMFRVGNETEGYPIRVAGYSGDAGDALSYHDSMKFSTYDRENDAHSSQHCAREHKGGWWYKYCQSCNLNSMYPTGPLPDYAPTYMSWYTFIMGSDRGKFEQEGDEVIFSEMKVRVSQ